MHTCWVSIKKYFLNHLQVCTAWVTFKCIRSEWPSSAYRLGDFQIYTAWVILKSIRAEWFHSVYRLSYLEEHTFWMTSSSYHLSNLWVYWLSHFEVYTPWVTSKQVHPGSSPSRLHAASWQQPYTSTSSTESVHEVSEFEHFVVLDTLRLNRDLQQCDDEDDEHNELLHLGILIITDIWEVLFWDRQSEIESISQV